MIDRFQKELQKLTTSSEPQKVLVAISGGLDSVVLTHLLHQSGHQLVLAHVNFSLRGDESDEDERFVRDLGRELGIQVFVKYFYTADYAANNHLSIQVAARELRYQWFEQVAEEQNCDYIAVAHHQDDQIETFFINLLRGSGLHGLKGMPQTNGKIIRPLLFAGRNEIEQYAAINGLSWRNDSSNKKNDYLRNKLRNKILPEIMEVSPTAYAGIRQSIAHLAAHEKLLNELILEKRLQILHSEKKYFYILKSDLSGFQHPGALLFEILREFGFNGSQTDDIAAKLDSAGAVFYSETHLLSLEREQIEIHKLEEESPELFIYLEEETRSLEEPINLQISILEHLDSFVPEKNPAVASFDVDLLSFPLHIRKWRQGDRFVPFGMIGSKLLSDYFTDKHFSRFEKESVQLLCDHKGLILWVIGHRQADFGKITSETRSVYQIRLL
ncbi:MAG: tRNA lysidine(34) synthetase TilS [Bacteroidales bacterium]